MSLKVSLEGKSRY